MRYWVHKEENLESKVIPLTEISNSVLSLPHGKVQQYFSSKSVVDNTSDWNSSGQIDKNSVSVTNLVPGNNSTSITTKVFRNKNSHEITCLLGLITKDKWIGASDQSPKIQCNIKLYASFHLSGQTKPFLAVPKRNSIKLLFKVFLFSFFSLVSSLESCSI